MVVGWAAEEEEEEATENWVQGRSVTAYVRGVRLRSCGLGEGSHHASPHHPATMREGKRHTWKIFFDATCRS